LQDHAPDEKVSQTVRNLEKSIEQAIGRSPQVEECLTRLRNQGYEVALLLQATLVYAPLGELDESHVETVAGVSEDDDAEFRMSTLDRKFLRSLKIAADEE
jgi:hypothetical protein